MKTAIAIALGIVFGYAAHEASAGVEWMYVQPLGDDEAAPQIVVPADGQRHTWRSWDYNSGEYRWGSVQAYPSGAYRSWDYSTGDYRWGRVDVD